MVKNYNKHPKVKLEDLKGEIKDFPIEVVQKMCDYQVEQGNEFNVEVFTEKEGLMFKGFNWGNTKYGWGFWTSVIICLNFDLFFEKYPKKETHEDIDNIFFTPSRRSKIFEYKEIYSNSGIKHSTEKLEMSKLFIQFPDALKAVMLTSTFGHIKYKEFDEDWINFKRVEGLSYEDALVRHQFLKSEQEEESKLHPKFHVAWNALADLQKYIEENNIDVDNLAKDKISKWEGEFNV